MVKMFISGGFQACGNDHETTGYVSREGEEIELEAHGRHDPCVIPRAVPVVEAMAAIVVLDMLLEAQSEGIER